jgi:Sec-independent protein translocase protein TatA
MFGLSLNEFLVIFIIAILIIGPKDMPEIARQITRLTIKGKHFIAKAKEDLAQLGRETGIDEIKNEIEIELANEKSRLEKEMTTIIDIYGNEHQIYGVDEIRVDKSKEEIAKEVEELNKNNSKNHSKNPLPNNKKPSQTTKKP